MARLAERKTKCACSAKISRGWGKDYAESASINEEKRRMASGTHTRALGTPPAQIRTYEEVRDYSTFQDIWIIQCSHV